MNKRIYRNLFYYLFFPPILLFGCSPSSNIDIDLSNLPKPKINQITDIVEEEIVEEDNNL